MNELGQKKILVVDDERELLKVTKDCLIREGYFNIYTAETCKDALTVIRTQPIALCILDVMLPDGNGFSLYEEIRTLSQMPVIFLTARGEDEDRIRGLELGADDYIVKPFLTKELLLRVTALLRRTYLKPQTAAGFHAGNRYVDFETASVTSDNSSVSLTAKEFILLKKLWENQNRIVTNDALCLAAWGDAYYGYENTLMVHIRRIREKLEENPSAPKHLITVKGLGYKLVTEHE
ncbi:MAG: response regulator transcription factor [bacterium]|nr:response regulator transcription factor [bacterium]